MKAQNENWKSIADTIIYEMKHQKYQKGEKLPTENEMAERFGVPRSDIRKVYGRLKEWGYIQSVRGRGSFFVGEQKKIPFSLVRGRSFTQTASLLGLHYEVKNVFAQRIAYQAEIYHAFQAKENEAIWKIALLRLLDGMPAALHIRYLPEKLFPSLPQEVSQISSFYEFLDQHYPGSYKNTAGRYILEYLPKEEREWLELPEYATERIYTAKTVGQTDGVLLELCRTIYRSDRFIFLLDEEVPPFQ